MTIITIDGNIGAGKTTILNYIHANHNIFVDLEPIDKWKPFLDDIYLNKQKFFNFQIRVWLDRSWIQEKDNFSTIVMERSPYFIRNTFNKTMIDNGLVNSQEGNIMNELYDKTDIIWKSNYYIYIRSCPQKCLDRIIERGRENEMNINIDYLNDIHNLHEETYKKAIKEGRNIICIDIENKEIEEIANEIIAYIKKIKS
jgi:deoxyadenosine/deoxycytidine kinase